jgi:hypothetical protein
MLERNGLTAIFNACAQPLGEYPGDMSSDDAATLRPVVRE